MYKNQRNHYEDTKSSAYSFVLVGVLGIVLLLLIDFNIISLDLSDYMRIMINIVMGVLFIFFLFVGIKSFLNLKKISIAADEQDNKEDTVVSAFLEKHKSFLQEYQPENFGSEEIYYPRSEKIRELLISDYPDFDDEELDYFIELLYTKIYG